MVAEGWCEQHTCGSLVWKRQNDVRQRVLETGTVEHNELAFPRNYFKRSKLQECTINAVAVQSGSINDRTRANAFALTISISQIDAPMTLIRCSLNLKRAVYSLAVLANDATVCTRMSCIRMNEIVRINNALSV